MLNKLKTSIVWWLGGTTVFSTIVYLLKGDIVLAILAFFLGFILFPPLTDIVLISKHPRFYKLIIVVVVVILAFYYSSLKDKEESQDKVEISHLKEAVTIAADYCHKNGKCADNIFQLKNVDSKKYEYKSIDGGKDCVLYTKLPSSKNYSEICLDGNNLEYIKYIRF